MRREPESGTCLKHVSLLMTNELCSAQWAARERLAEGGGQEGRGQLQRERNQKVTRLLSYIEIQFNEIVATLEFH